MAYQGDGIDWGNATAGADLSSSQYLAVQVAADGDIEVSATDGAAIGILQNEPTENQVAAVRVVGISKAVAGAHPIAPLALVAAGTAGKIEPATTGQEVLGIALTATGAINDVITILVLPTQRTV
jgi:hypothetical protein